MVVRRQQGIHYILYPQFILVVFQSLGRVWLPHHRQQHTRLPCPSPHDGVCPSSHLLVDDVIQSSHPLSFLLLLPSVFHSIRVCSNESVLHIKWPKYWSISSASVLPMNIQDWFLLGLVGLISLQSKGLTRIFSNPQFKSINILALSFVYGPTLTSTHDYWKNHSFDYMELCQ